jgi:diguanylate cyclase (GGDEF)-like protein
MQLIRDGSTTSIHRRLNAAKEIVFREFKRQEELLATYITFLEQLHFLDDQIADSDDVGILQDRLYTTLEKAGIAVTFYPLDHEAILPSAMKELFQQTRRSGQPRFRYTNELNGVPTLVAAAPLYTKHEITKILVLSSAFGSDFLDRVLRPLGMGASLHDLSGKLLTSTSIDVSPMALNLEQLRALATRGTLFAEHPSVDGTISHLFALIPVGDSDMVMLSVETSSAEVAALETTMLVRLALTIGVALLLGAIIYFRAIATITQPARELLNAAKAISRGNFSYRITDISNDELGEVAVTFNQMAGEIDAIYQEKSARETESVVALQEAKARALLEHKNREIERVNKELRDHLREVSALYQLNQAMVSATEMNAMFDRVLQTIIETLGCDQAVILLYNHRESHLEVARFAGLSHNTIENVRFRLDQGITGHVAQALKQVYVRDVTKDERYLSYHEQVAVRGSFVATPLVVKGRLVGVLNLHKREIKAFHGSELKMIQAIANQVAIVTENTRLIEKARDSANIDDVTGLANRRYFQEILKREVAQARRFNSNFSVVMCTIDHFDSYLETHGRPQGESLLQQVGNLLLNNTRGIDLVCRFGGQEFAILLPKTRKDGGVAAAEKLRHAALAEDYPGAGASQPEKRVTLSFGVAEFPDDSKNIYELINLADRALLQARRDGSNRTLAWDEFMGSEPEAGDS